MSYHVLNKVKQLCGEAGLKQKPSLPGKKLSAWTCLQSLASRVKECSFPFQVTKVRTHSCPLAPCLLLSPFCNHHGSVSAKLGSEFGPEFLTLFTGSKLGSHLQPPSYHQSDAPSVLFSANTLLSYLTPSFTGLFIYPVFHSPGFSKPN